MNWSTWYFVFMVVLCGNRWMFHQLVVWKSHNRTGRYILQNSFIICMLCNSLWLVYQKNIFDFFFKRWYSYILSIIKFVFPFFIYFFQDVSKAFIVCIHCTFLDSNKQKSSYLFTHCFIFTLLPNKLPTKFNHF